MIQSTFINYILGQKALKKKKKKKKKKEEKKKKSLVLQFHKFQFINLHFVIHFIIKVLKLHLSPQ